MSELRERTATPVCHVVTHVHWDREWYRPFESYRARLVELVEQVCRQLDSGSLEAFHLDGQTITVRDVGDLRPDLVDEVRRHVRAGRLTIGPWHVLADNQLVSGENLVRNLLAARRHGAEIGDLTGIGYSPDAFGHPADLPRILQGFGIGTALVWRGAPPELAEFRWRSPDGSEVHAVSQRYHEAEVLWTPEGRDGRLAAFLAGEAERRPAGPWLLMNGGDHLAPRDTTGVLAEVASAVGSRVELPQSSLEAFFAAVRDSRPAPSVVDGELRRLGGPGSFLLPGTLSARVHLKQENARAERLLERIVEPLLALEQLTPATPSAAPVPDATPLDGSSVGHLRHAWELVLENAPHDSICGCSVDEVHRENSVRTDRVVQLADQLVRRALLRRGFDTRVHGAPATEAARVVVFVPPAAAGREVPVEVEVVVAPDRAVVRANAPDGTEVPIEVEDLGVRRSFEADLDLLPDSVVARVQRLRFVATGVAPGGLAVYDLRLGAFDDAGSATAAAPAGIDEEVDLGDGLQARIAADGSFSVTDAAGIRHDGLARLVDGGDRGDTYNYDPPADDRIVTAVAGDVRVRRTPVRTVVSWTATLDLPLRLDEGRDARTAESVATPVAVELAHWHGRPGLEWSARFVNSALDHRLRVHSRVRGTPSAWTSGQHFSNLARPFGPELGPLPDAANREAEIGTHPAHGYVVAGEGDRALALLLDHVSEVQGLEARPDGDAELAVTMLRSVGWLSRFDLRTRTTGAGPELPAPEAQLLRPIEARLGFLLGSDALDAFALADAADARRAGAIALQLREGTPVSAPAVGSAIEVEGAIVSALKPAEDGNGVILRVANPSPAARDAAITIAPGIDARPVRLDESPAPGELVDSSVAATGSRRVSLRLAPHATVSLRLEVAR
ncbi:glycosyl hydrolase-related protein [Agromyces aurantiacus]|uniref:Glycosyl hydrolase-related protein n=1 Tax=Agromyces aurantiacus TaxID=165814 RepID=A0ABV9R5U5_9MICO|nr:glycosyl hydrolase-related protein [Agromyces aurantiacus]MBM7503609.1 alpha-mannosidase/mannosylglycerate hydrolase [Agromyces aurantiacus]